MVSYPEFEGNKIRTSIADRGTGDVRRRLRRRSPW